MTDPALDWSADGCTGPIRPSAGGACLRSEFMWRNTRMFRDAFGLSTADVITVADGANDLIARGQDVLRTDYFGPIGPIRVGVSKQFWGANGAP